MYLSTSDRATQTRLPVTLGDQQPVPASLPAEARRLIDEVRDGKASSEDHQVLLGTLSPALSDFPVELLREQLSRKHQRVLAVIGQSPNPDATLRQVADALDNVRIDLYFGKTAFHYFVAREKALLDDLLTAFTCVADYRRLRHLYPRLRLGPVPPGAQGLVGFKTGRGIIRARVGDLVRLGRAWVSDEKVRKRLPPIMKRVGKSPMRDLLFFRLGSELLAGAVLLKDDKPKFKQLLRKECKARRAASAPG